MAAVLLRTPVSVIAEREPSNRRPLDTFSGPVPAIVPPAHFNPLLALIEALKVCVPPPILIGNPPLNDAPLLKVWLPLKTIGAVLLVPSDPLCVPPPLRSIGPTLALLPLAIAGNIVGFWLVRVTPQELFYKLTLVIMLLLSCELAREGLLGIWHG